MLMPPVKADVAASVAAAAGDGCWLLTAGCSAAVELLVTVAVATFLAQNIFVFALASAKHAGEQSNILCWLVLVSTST